MSDVVEEFITLTPLTCVHQCNALLGETTGKPRSCFVFFTLFGVYCGVLVLRAYRTYSSRHGGDGVKISEGVTLEAKAEELDFGPGPSLVKEFVQQAKPILLQPVELSSTDMRWRYCNNLTEDEFNKGYGEEVAEKTEEFERIGDEVADDELPTVSVATSTSRARSPARENNVDKERVETKTFSV
ncbi:uncharacterized protein LOC108104543 [Drosophila eugracilis]|uniref:uncharacterized protein LOC108104543 n=1 Tax=Drosophila eugracilis TaxID=29029 RepID=UPI0007E71D53|nr:uncharacterized protein LOC108104543 [Drosophila eugracilis]